MTSLYTTSGDLLEPVSDRDAARKYLQEQDMAQFIPSSLREAVRFLQWGMVGNQGWKVTVIANRELTAEESAALSEWISGQNSDGLGEGFEQQPFAEHEDDEENYSMSSFDWQTNRCILKLVKTIAS